jgi:hypothetical protein
VVFAYLSDQRHEVLIVHLAGQIESLGGIVVAAHLRAESFYRSVNGRLLKGGFGEQHCSSAFLSVLIQKGAQNN